MIGRCRIGGLTLDGDNAALLRDGAALPLGRRAVLLLLELVRQRGEIVTKETLLNAAWPDQAVEESNLTVQISHLRRVLSGEAAAARSWVETLPRRGYRFVGPAVWEPAAMPAGQLGAPLSNIPIAVPLHFTGREAAAEAMAAALGQSAPSPAIVVLHGMRGLGKTMLAAAFSRHVGERYRATWWIRAEDAATARADLVALALRLGWVRPGTPETAAHEAALERVQREGRGLLLIYDNAVDAGSLRPMLPKVGGSHIIITSNSGVWRAVGTPIEPGLWDSDTGAAFLVARTGRTGERAAAAALSQLLGGLPLAHEQAAAYVESLEIGFAEYQHRLEAAPIRVLDDPDYAPADYYGGLTVAKALHLAVAQAGARNPIARPLLQHIALLAAEPVPLALLRTGMTLDDPVLPGNSGGELFEDAVAVLRRLALVSREAVPDAAGLATANDSVRLHRLVRQIVAWDIPVEVRGRMRAALTHAMVTVYPVNVFDRPETWPRAHRLDALAKALVVPTSTIAPGAEAPALELLVGLASYRHGPLGSYHEARQMFKAALLLSEATHGPVHEMTATLLNNLALVFRDSGELAQARPIYERALAVRETVLGLDHPEVAVTLNNLGNVIAESGDPAGAIPLLERALAIRLAHVGEQHRYTALMMNNLARHLHMAGQTDRARPLLERALALRQVLFGPGDPHTANSMANLALLLLDTGEPDRAVILSGQALAVTEAALGPEHPLITSICAIHAQCLLAQAGSTAALPYAERALLLGQRLLAPTSQHLRRAATVTADCLDRLDRSQEATAVRSLTQADLT